MDVVSCAFFSFVPSCTKRCEGLAIQTYTLGTNPLRAGDDSTVGL